MPAARLSMIDPQAKHAEYPPVTEELLSKISERLLSCGSPLKIILFGSRARGTARPDSDLDIIIIEEPCKDCEKRRVAYRDAIWGLFPDIGLLVYSIDQVAAWRNVPNHLLSIAMREGKVLFEDQARLSKYYLIPPGWQGECEQFLVCEGVQPETSNDYTRDWFKLGDSDLEDARFLAGLTKYRGASFHVQQAVEKYLKGYLCLRGLVPEKTHNVLELYGDCRQLVDMPDLPEGTLKTISDYAISGRYDVRFAPHLREVESGIEIAEQVRTAILNKVPPDARPQP